MSFLRQVLLLLIVLAAGSVGGPASAMDFRLASIGGNCGAKCPIVIVATGEIYDSTDKEFISFIKTIPNDRVRRTLIIHSPGGSLWGGMKFGIVLRAAKMTTLVGQVVQEGGLAVPVNGSCMSACVYAIMGGTTRIVMPSCRIGIHRATVTGSAGNGPLAILRQQQRMPENVEAMLRSYVKFMGVNTRIVDWAEKIGPGGIRILTPAEITQTHLAKIGR